jgi:RNA polymerase subunit RPABC4/transcription elongation factor Spt4
MAKKLVHVYNCNKCHTLSNYDINDIDRICPKCGADHLLMTFIEQKMVDE